MEKLQHKRERVISHRSRRSMMLVLVSLLFLGGCVSGFQTVAPNAPEKFEKLGPATGSACGTLVGGPTAYNAIPILLNSRVERAYQDALESVPGSNALINVTMQENWFWWVIGSTRCVTIAGEAIR